MLPMVAGGCTALISRYGWNAKAGACQQFSYGGCKGNANNFSTLAGCNAVCGAPPTLDAPTVHHLDGGWMVSSFSPPSCGLPTTVHEDFESGLDPTWSLVNGDAITIDDAQPLVGAKSMRVTLRDPTSRQYASIPLPSSPCDLRLSLVIDVSAQLLTTGFTLARLNAGNTRFFLEVRKGGSVGVSQEIRAGGMVGFGWGVSLGALDPSWASVISLSIDTQRRILAGAVGPVGTSLPPLRSTAFGPKSNATAVTSIDLGSLEFYGHEPLGIYVLDGLASTDRAPQDQGGLKDEKRKALAPLSARALFCSGAKEGT